MKVNRFIPLALIISLSIVGFLFLSFQQIKAEEPITVSIEAFQFGYNPERIHVKLGQPVTFILRSLDVTHGFYIDGKHIKAEVPPGKTVTVGPIVFDNPGKFKIRCAHLCGPLHPFMVADLIVEPAFPLNAFQVFAILTIALAIGIAIYSWKYELDNTLLGVPIDKEIDLLKVRDISLLLLKRLLHWRGIHFFLILPNFLIFLIVIVTGLFGNPLGALNFSIAVVWILWFAAVEFLIFFAGRTWCTLCPLPALGEWVARRRLYSVRLDKWLSLNRRWPAKLSNLWIPALGFLGISLIVPWLVTRPVVTALLFISLMVLGLILHLVFVGGHRIFCRYVCPASGYIGYSSSSSIFSVRPRDRKICDAHKTKDCIRGKAPWGYGCPWRLYPGGITSNINCGQCYECLKSCPFDNMTLKLRMVGKENIERGEATPSEAWMGFIRFTLAIFYELVLFGSAWWIKDWANMGVNFGANLPTIGALVPTPEGFAHWLIWAGIVSSISLAIFPAIFYAFSWLAKMAAKARDIETRRVFLTFSNSLAPYQLLLWMSFALTLLAVNWAYPLRAFSDPMGRGINILGLESASKLWQPMFADFLPFIQAIFTFFGLALAIGIVHKLSIKLFGREKAMRSTAVMSTLHTLSGLIFMWVLFG